MQPTAGYRWRAGALLRATTDPGALDLPRDLDLFSDTGIKEARVWLAGLWQRQDLRDALAAASPGLCRQISDVVAEERCAPRQVRRSVLSLAAYLLRWSSRPTPFGLFAGVAPARITAPALAAWGHRHRTVARADAWWLTGVIDRLHQCRPLRERLAVVSNDTGRRRGDRYVVPGPPPGEDPKGLAPLEVSVRHTRPVIVALEAAREPIVWRELRALLGEKFPAVPAGRIDDTLGDLLAQNVLISCLRAPMTCLDALGHVCTQLDAVEAHEIPAVADLVRTLHALREELAAPPTGGWSSRPRLAARMREVSTSTSLPMVIDTSLDCDVRLPHRVVAEAEGAVNVLHRLSPYPFGYPAWRDYHARFRARYGTAAAVPVLDLVADSGLGLPAGYLGSACPSAPRQLTDRDRKLLRLVQRAAVEDRGEIVLTEPVIKELQEETETLPVPRVEVAIEIHAAGADALTRGSFRILVTGTPRPGSSMAGRFAHLLPAQDHARLAATYQAAGPDSTAAQLSFAPRRRRNENITRTQPLLPHVIALGEHRAPHRGLIALADLAVTADAHRLYLVRLSTGQRIEARVAHALEAGVHTPPLARFLAEVASSRCAVYKSFDFGAAAHLPFLPRVRYKRAVLAPARWLLTGRELPGRDTAVDTWEKQFAAWRARQRVPDRVTLVEGEQRLRLDLTHALHRLLLRTRLNASQRLELREAPGCADLAWIGRAHELLLPLTATAPAVPAATAPAPAPARTEDCVHLPGRSALLSAQLHTHPGRYDEILAEHLPALLASFTTAPQWWFSRHRVLPRPDADQYLSVCLHLHDADAYGQAAALVHDWACGLRRKHLIAHLSLATYEPQSARYGHGPAMTAAYQVFADDSAAALAQIRMTALGATSAQALTAASLVDLVVSFTASPDEGLHWLLHHFPQQHGRLDSALRDQALALTDPHRREAALLPRPHPDDHTSDVATAWERRAAALVSYRIRLGAQRDPLTALPGLLRLHQVRALGLDQHLRRVSERLARTCALHHARRRPR